MIKVRFFTFSPVQENTYVLYNEQNKAIIIDPGCYFTAEQETLKKFIEDTQLEPVRLLNTHCHLDHVFGNKWVSETWNLELHLHAGEEQMLKLAPLSGEKWGLPFQNYSGPLHFLEEGDTIRLGNDALKVILAPGHSPASICFYCEEQGFLVGGDVLFRESIGRTDLPGGNHETLLKNIREKLFVLPDEVVVYPGHGPSTTIGHEKTHNPFL
ncbi:MAG: MBL fold metallo-hydrolase [Chitinophagaceae bacterium]|nr:MBL fold metallo-hydrolase [Chitinophagaceae bacterium]MEA3425851.1 MBL fold metallo-hydrolase [Bacteroidota bacterium]MCA6453782.1 MBL fold metallo-hydrolase [Chitinophagaceae bacterium]MCA6455305.1 MBL fold metallo-hydrolase [Chitinophagaceae bacterium]MCA6460114.1 MBL fold metallo-hydrolase [Chitinophagaceae bacterium]